MRHSPLSAAAFVIAAALGAAACSPSGDAAETPAAAPATPAAATDPDVYRFKLGSLDLIALRDGGLVAPNDNKILGVGRTPADVSAVLTANDLPGDTVSLSIQPLLMQAGERTVLFDGGAGASFGPKAGKLPASLKTAGIELTQITDVLISHSHGDHVVGLVDANGALTFPNATIRISAPEWTFMKANPELAAVVKAITPKVETFQPGATVAPGVTAVAINGHTPGHMGYEIASGSEKMLYIGDTMHHSVVSVQRPAWQIAFDSDAPTATASREALVERAVAENLRLYAVHFPFPGVGRIQKQGDANVWVPGAQ